MFCPGLEPSLLGRQAAWRPERLGKTSSLTGASAVHGELQVLRPCAECSWRTVKLLGGPHSSEGSRMIGDDVFFSGESDSPPGTSLIGAPREVQAILFGRQAAG